MDYKKSKELGYMHPMLVKKAAEFKKKCKKAGIKIKFSEGFRTVEEQNELYAQGRTKPGNIVTNARGSSYSSQHQWGIAVDFYLNMDIDGDGLVSDDAFNNATGMFEKAGAIATKIQGLGWGGNWKSLKDRPHIYLDKWGSNTSILKSEYETYEKFKETWSSEQKTEASGSDKEFIKAIQLVIGVKVDGIVGYKTLEATPTLSKFENRKHKCVRIVQGRLNKLGFACGVEDGIFGNKTEIAVERYQEYMGLQYVDGVITAGKNTWKSLLGVI